MPRTKSSNAVSGGSRGSKQATNRFKSIVRRVISQNVRPRDRLRPLYERQRYDEPRQGPGSVGPEMGSSSVPLSVVPRNASSNYKLSSPNTRGIRVTHREMVVEVKLPAAQTSMADPNVIRYVFQPGLSSQFPWLSQLSTCFEFYRVHRLIVYYTPTCPTSTAGSIMLVPESDVLDPLPTSMMSATSGLFSITSPVYLSIHTPLPFQNRTYRVRPNLNDGRDPYECDASSVDVLLASTSQSTSIGQLWFEYDVELLVPQVHEDVSGSCVVNSADGRLYLNGVPLAPGAAVMPSLVAQSVVGGTHANVTFERRPMEIITAAVVTGYDNATVTDKGVFDSVMGTHRYQVYPSSFSYSNMTLDIVPAIINTAFNVFPYGWYDV